MPLSQSHYWNTYFHATNSSWQKIQSWSYCMNSLFGGNLNDYGWKYLSCVHILQPVKYLILKMNGDLLFWIYIYFISHRWKIDSEINGTMIYRHISFYLVITRRLLTLNRIWFILKFTKNWQHTGYAWSNNRYHLYQGLISPTQRCAILHCPPKNWPVRDCWQSHRHQLCATHSTTG